MKESDRIAAGSKQSGLTPFLATRRELEALFASPSLAKRMIKAGWVSVVRAGGPGRETLFDFASARQAYERLKAGEEPPMLPCESGRRKSQ